mmetsp:Transcript_31277/g.68329  ORF Transcript_31277/g.68329 Transcript_31277/m.68329 type:complete len:81 (+) Transcript_31277:109-351(+)
MHDHFVDMVYEVRKKNPEYAVLDVNERNFFLVLVVIGFLCFWFLSSNSALISQARKNISAEFNTLNKKRVDDANWERLTI